MNGEVLEIHDYLRILRYRWLLVAIVTLAAVGVAVLLTLSMTPQYKSTARLFISTQSDTTDAYQGSLFSQQRVKSYADLLTGGEIHAGSSKSSTSRRTRGLSPAGSKPSSSQKP